MARRDEVPYVWGLLPLPQRVPRASHCVGRPQVVVSRIQMSGPAGRWVCGLLLLTLGLTAACTSGPNQKSAAVTTPPSAPATSPAALLGSPHRSEQATVERVRAYLESNRPFQHILTAGFDGRVLCGVYLWAPPPANTRSTPRPPAGTTASSTPRRPKSPATQRWS